MTSHIQILQNPLTISQADLGIFKSTLLPSLQLHSGLAVIAYLAGRVTDRVEIKDWLWPSGMVINALWSAIGRRVYNGITARQAWRMLPWSEKLILSTVTIWGTRLFYRIATRSIARGADDPRYTEVKKEKGFWNNAIFSTFLPEAVVQAVICLPFTMPFRSEPVVAFGAHPELAGVARSIAVGMFAAGMALEVLADTQIEQHKKKGRSDLCRDGVFSIVRHPNYLGDTLVHCSFLPLLYSANLLHPLTIAGPLANYIFLRFIGGDKENEANQEARYKTDNKEKYEQLQEWKVEKNSFWPKVEEITNPWTLVVLGCGVVGAAAEVGLRSYYMPRGL